MRTLREILRLKYEAKLPHRAIARWGWARSLSLHRGPWRRGSADRYPRLLDDAALEAKLLRQTAPFHALSFA
ncbi:MAG: hypothetical protein ACREX4_17490 [Gammaproteobacteria bacterium]